MSKAVLKELPKLLEAQVIDQSTVGRIQSYYKQQKANSPNKQLLVFGVLGALLIGSGLILIFGYNWDGFPCSVKTFLAFLPLVLAQGFAFFTLWKKPENRVFREVSGTLLYFAIGGSIALISQVYNLGGKFTNFLMVWHFLALPVAYLLRSSAASLLYIGGITLFASYSGYWNRGGSPWVYLPLLAGIIPFIIGLFKQGRQGAVMVFHHWVLAFSIAIGFGAMIPRTKLDDLVIISVAGVSVIYLAFAQMPIWQGMKKRQNPWLLLGGLGMVFCGLVMSFEDYWSGFFYKANEIKSMWFLLVATFGITAFAWSAVKRKKQLEYVTTLFPLMVLGHVIGGESTVIASIIISLGILAVSVLTILKGANANNLGRLNFGLVMLLLLIGFKFFSVDISFLIRGLVFIVLGVCFLMLNVWIMRRKKQDDSKGELSEV